MTAVPTSRSLPAELAEPLARVAPRLASFRPDVLWFESIGSTNDVAMMLAERDAAEGTVVAADEQRQGRGRRGHTWASPAGAGLYVSVVVRPPTPTPLLTLAAGVALAQGLRASTGLHVDLKWPNDLYVGARKLAGILAEGGSSRLGSFVVVGFGINVSSASYPPDVAARATSVESELGRPVDRGLVFAETLAAFFEVYQRVMTTPAAVLRAWRDEARATQGRRVEWVDGSVARFGIARDVDTDGALLVEAADGTVRIIGGEVRWV